VKHGGLYNPQVNIVRQGGEERSIKADRRFLRKLEVGKGARMVSIPEGRVRGGGNNEMELGANCGFEGVANRTKRKEKGARGPFYVVFQRAWDGVKKTCADRVLHDVRNYRIPRPST